MTCIGRLPYLGNCETTTIPADLDIRRNLDGLERADEQGNEAGQRPGQPASVQQAGRRRTRGLTGGFVSRRRRCGERSHG